MARAGILYSQVAKAASQLAAAGKAPTIDTVREALGDTGSKSTIAPMLKRWKAEHQEVVAGGDTGLPVDLVEAVKGVYQRLQDEVARQLEAANEAHEQAQAVVRNQRDAALATEAQLRQVHTTLAGEHAQTQQALVRCQQDLQTNVLALTAAQTENVGLVQRLSDRAAEAHALNQQLTQTRTQFEHFQEAAARQRAEERQAFEQRLARLEQKNISGQRRQEAQQAMLGQQEATLAHQMSELERLRDALAEAHNELHHVRSERTQQAGQLQELAAARIDAERRLEMAQQALTHDTTFLGELIDLFERHGTQNIIHFLTWNGGHSGKINDGLPWHHQTFKDRIDKLEQAQRYLEKSWPPYPDEEQSSAMRQQYSKLRATIERMIQDIVFNGVVVRYRDWIKVGNLGEVVTFEDTDCKEIERLHKACCDVTEAHDPSSAKNTPVPTAQQLGIDIAALVAVAQSIRTKRDAKKKAAKSSP